jgi:hypothetical protein
LFNFKAISRILPIFIAIIILILIFTSDLFMIALRNSWDLIHYTFDVEEFKFWYCWNCFFHYRVCIWKLYLFHKFKCCHFPIEFSYFEYCRNLIIYLYYQFHYFVIICGFNVAKMYFHFLFLFFKFPNLENYWVAHFL